MNPAYSSIRLSLMVVFSFLFIFSNLHFQAQSDCETFFNKLVINEVMTSNSSTASDEAGEFDDWVEIYNGSEEIINLEGYFLSDSRSDRTKFIFPDMEIGPDGYVIVWCDNQPEQGPLHAAFGLNADGEHLGLYDPDTVSMDYVRFREIPTNITMGRYPNGTGPFKILIPSYNGANTNSVDVGVVINEYQAINETTADDQWGSFEDWIELYNNSNQPINLEGYFLSDRIGEPTQFVFPDTIIEAGGYIIIWCDMGLMEPGLHTFFGLGGSGDDILLSNPDTVTIDYVRFGEQIPDDSEGRFPNGTGPFECLIPSHEMSNGDPVSVLDLPGRFKTLEIWPNPAMNYIRLDWEGNSPEPLLFYDLQGREVKQMNLVAGQQEISLEGLNSGVYLLRAGLYKTKLVIY